MSQPKVYFRESDGVYTFFCRDDKGKELQVPKEQSKLEEVSRPSETTIKYWSHYGIDRRHFVRDAIPDPSS